MIRISLSQRLSALQKHSPLLTTGPHSSLSYQHKRQKIKVIKDTLSLTIHSALSLRKPIRKTSLTLTNHTHTKKPFSSSLSPLNSQLTHSSKFPLTPSTQIRRSINKTLASLKFHSSSPKSSRRHTQPTNRNPRDPPSTPFQRISQPSSSVDSQLTTARSSPTSDTISSPQHRKIFQLSTAVD